MILKLIWALLLTWRWLVLTEGIHLSGSKMNQKGGGRGTSDGLRGPTGVGSEPQKDVI
jgi:hypothetical protein